MNPQQIQQLKEIMHQVQNSNNRYEMIQNLLAQNPNYQNISNLLQLNNGNLQQTAQFIARQKGIDLNNLIQQLTNNDTHTNV